MTIINDRIYVASKVFRISLKRAASALAPFMEAILPRNNLNDHNLLNHNF